jgi:hypothetical protein
VQRIARVENVPTAVVIVRHQVVEFKIHTMLVPSPLMRGSMPPNVRLGSTVLMSTRAIGPSGSIMSIT